MIFLKAKTLGPDEVDFYINLAHIECVLPVLRTKNGLVCDNECKFYITFLLNEHRYATPPIYGKKAAEEIIKIIMDELTCSDHSSRSPKTIRILDTGLKLDKLS